jgi:acyl dehydratase
VGVAVEGAAALLQAMINSITIRPGLSFILFNCLILLRKATSLSKDMISLPVLPCHVGWNLVWGNLVDLRACPSGYNVGNQSLPLLEGDLGGLLSSQDDTVKPGKQHLIMTGKDQTHIWNMLEAGDTAPPYTFEVTVEKIAEYRRAARYENLVYTNQPAARETGLPGIIAPPAMVLVYAPIRFKELLAARGFETRQEQHIWREMPLANIVIQFYEALVEPGDAITSVTSVQEKSQEERGKTITLQVTAHNQRDELVVQYQYIYRWPENTE